MALETGTYIDDLNENNPTGSDSTSKGDDHIRLIKKTILNTFPNITNAVTATHGELNKLDGCTATTAELNILDGYTGSTADLNNVVGVITTQGDIMFGDSNGDEKRRAIGGNNNILYSDGNTPQWGKLTYAMTNFSNNIAQGDIADNAIGRGELNTATTTESRTASGQSIRTGSWGQFGFMYESRIDASGSGDGGQFLGRAQGSAGSWAPDSPGSGDTGYNPNVTLFNQNGIVNPYIKVRYVQASPPYDLGDGEAGLFVTLDILPSGEIAGTSIAPDPVWANNGPTDITPHRIDKQGRKFRRVRRPQLTDRDVRAGRASMEEFAAAFREAPVEEIEITQEMKNADMSLYPHSWVTGIEGQIYMLDPVNTHDLLSMHEDGIDIADLLVKGYIRPSNRVLKRNAPPGVLPISFRWKNTR